MIFCNSIDEDILNLVDEMDLDEFLKEASAAMEDAEKLSEFIQEKSTIAIERFLVRAIFFGADICLSEFYLCIRNDPFFENHRITFRRCQFQLKNETLLMVGS